MSKMFRLSKEEERKLQEKCIEINKLLIGNNRQPMKDTELLHKILIDAINRIKMNKDGDISLS